MSDTDKWYISGPLGIGESEPYAPLVVAGEISLKSPDSDIHSLRFKRTDEENRTHEWAFWHMNEKYRKNALEIWEYKTDSSGKACDGITADGAMCNPRLVILEGGNVGIGTTEPKAKLDVNGNIAITAYPGSLMIGGTDNTFSVLKAEPGTLTINEGSWAKVVIPTGNVGIGTTTPNAALEVMQTVNGLSTGLQFGGQHTPGITAGGVINSCDANTHVRPLTLQSNGGNVGISINTPQAKLHVNGDTLIGGTLRASSEIQTTAANAFRMVCGNFGSFFRNDGNDTYLLLTNSGDQYGNWNGLRPLRINNNSGTVALENVVVANGIFSIKGAYDDWKAVDLLKDSESRQLYISVSTDSSAADHIVFYWKNDSGVGMKVKIRGNDDWEHNLKSGAFD